MNALLNTDDGASKGPEAAPAAADPAIAGPGDMATGPDGPGTDDFARPLLFGSAEPHLRRSLFRR